MTSYLQCGGRLGTHTGWSEILRTCTRAVCTGVHPSLSGHRILEVVSRFKRLDQDVEQGQPSIVIEEGQNGPPYGAEGSPPEGLRDSGVSDGTVNLGAYSEAAEKLWRKARARGQGDNPRRHVTGAR